MIELRVDTETWPMARKFTISRGTKIVTEVVIAELRQSGLRGRGECVPYPHYGESVDSVIALIKSQAGNIAAGMSRIELGEALPPGAARNALDCALWDLEAKRSGRRIWELAGLARPVPCVCAVTIGIDSPMQMAAAAKALASYPLLKIKLNAELVSERMRRIRDAAPNARLCIDANESWTLALLEELGEELLELDIEMIEQPLLASADQGLADLDFPIPICADESLHSRAELADLQGRYDMVNIKLDKTGGLTEALALAETAREQGYALMVGCMVATSLGMAPATLLAPMAKVVDLDGPLLLARDRQHGLSYNAGMIEAPTAALWG